MSDQNAARTVEVPPGNSPGSIEGWLEAEAERDSKISEERAAFWDRLKPLKERRDSISDATAAEAVAVAEDMATMPLSRSRRPATDTLKAAGELVTNVRPKLQTAFYLQDPTGVLFEQTAAPGTDDTPDVLRASLMSTAPGGNIRTTTGLRAPVGPAPDGGPTPMLWVRATAVSYERALMFNPALFTASYMSVYARLMVGAIERDENNQFVAVHLGPDVLVFDETLTAGFPPLYVRLGEEHIYTAEMRIITRPGHRYEVLLWARQRALVFSGLVSVCTCQFEFTGIKYEFYSSPIS
ncbi:hypothetical protein SAMN04487914_11339 [Arthrobacter sp. ok909]|uniref:hypothetical protein n=1 Tax=Arthrobacter sp. ok909 TaxID=1761746 RepID=UPI000884C4F3|nr:hypothetical protein [Arthrobacter sp. ok909]SDP48971.1 hypothetical protein SAMN04487914_11339 [Arthrobacter sp. ok909]